MDKTQSPDAVLQCYFDLLFFAMENISRRISQLNAEEQRGPSVGASPPEMS